MDSKYKGIIETNAGGFGSAVASVELHFVVEQLGGHTGFQVHVFHGSPANADWWKSGGGIIASGVNMFVAKELIDNLVGRSGAHQFFDMVSRCTNVRCKLTLKD